MEATRPLEVDLAIVGNGAIGCALALRFVEEHRGARIALVGPQRRVASASVAAGAMLNVFAEVHPGDLADRTKRMKLDVAYAASQAWPAHVAMLQSRCGIIYARHITIEKGTYVLDSSTSLGPRFDAILEALRTYKVPFDEADPLAIAGLDLRDGVPMRALYIEAEGRIDARRLLAAYDEAFARSDRVVAVDGEATSITSKTGKHQIRVSSGAVVESPHVVIAAGARSQLLIEALGLDTRIPRIVAGAGTAILFDDEPGTSLTNVIRFVGEDDLTFDLYALPSGGCTYVGATMQIQSMSQTTHDERDVIDLRDAAERFIHSRFAKARVRDVLFGWRPVTQDGYPLVGKTSIDGIWMATGTGRDGLHMSPEIAKELARCITSKSDLQPFSGIFRPERPR